MWIHDIQNYMDVLGAPKTAHITTESHLISIKTHHSDRTRLYHYVTALGGPHIQRAMDSIQTPDEEVATR